ncbi:MAG TPA: ureidoglycolate hydrolase [Planctomycetaceae bacterium]|nr:ureidoglycolate hydrolase [Blastopirellula sp.]HAY81525.1 ureidoglycolate hydrolase [Planctomycetaceae bacterium]
MTSAPNYLDPQIPHGLRRVSIPVVDATAENLAGYGTLVSSPDAVDIEIVRWPAQGWRPVDEDSGDEGGTTQGVFISRWQGDVLYGSNAAVDGHYILGYAVEPHLAREDHAEDPRELLLWHANYHPDGGQLFFPEEAQPYLVPLALPGDDVQPQDFVCFRFAGHEGLYIHPNVWHEGVFTLRGEQRFFDQQGAVHARVSIDFPREFSCLLQMTW